MLLKRNYSHLENCFLVEDHHRVLNIWQKKCIKDCDLVHIDAHIDFDFIRIKEPIDIVKEAKSLTQLKSQIEESLLFQRFGFSKERLTNIGNYIYPAFRQNIIRNFYWVIPGSLSEFNQSKKLLKSILKNLASQDPYPQRKINIREGFISTRLFNRMFVICILEKLPILKQNVLLDIDTDFLVIDSLKKADSLSMIGKRQAWISVAKLANTLKYKIKNPICTTIAYSVNGGFTPIIYKFLGDELKFRLSDKIKPNQDKILLKQYNCKTKADWSSLLKQMNRRNGLKPHFKKKLLSNIYFNLFNLTSGENYYKNAIRLNPTYKIADNNYGNLYLAKGKLKKAEKEFKRIALIDSKNPFPILGLGNISLKRKDYHKAKRYFSFALRQRPDLAQALLGLAQTEFRLRSYSKARRLFLKYQSLEPMQPHSRYFLGRIYEGERNFTKSAQCYKEAINLGLNDIDIIKRLLEIGCRIKTKNNIIDFTVGRFKAFKRNFQRIPKRGLKKLNIITKKIAIVEKLLERIHKRKIINK